MLLRHFNLVVAGWFLYQPPQGLAVRPDKDLSSLLVKNDTEDPEPWKPDADEDADDEIIMSRRYEVQETFEVQQSIAKVRDWLDEKSLMPFWLMPISFSIKIVLTMAIFGTGIRTQDVKHDWVSGSLRLFGQLASLAFLIMALNTWRCDLLKILTAYKAFPGDYKKLLQVA